tara:strand:- start:824 stop:1252 length:429 start_codon:yes stop_codon:yes gene_type:complete
MAGTLVQSEFVYTSGTAPNLYQFTVVSNSEGAILVRNIEDPYGFVISPYTQIPQSVTDDIATAMGTVETLLALTSAVNGTLTFTAETSKSVVFSTPFANTAYRVHVTADVFAPFRITNKTTAGFTVSAGAAITASVGYDVLV